jgi:hypothetical protein
VASPAVGPYNHSRSLAFIFQRARGTVEGISGEKCHVQILELPLSAAGQNEVV